MSAPKHFDLSRWRVIAALRGVRERSTLSIRRTASVRGHGNASLSVEHLIPNVVSNGILMQVCEASRRPTLLVSRDVPYVLGRFCVHAFNRCWED